MRERILALVRKEWSILRRDRSSLLLGAVLPMLLMLLIGYGMSLDVKNVPTAVVLEDDSTVARHAASFTVGSEYFDPVFVHSLAEGEALLREKQVRAILRFPSGFSEQLSHRAAEVQIILDGVEASTAMSAESYLTSGLLSWVAEQGTGSQGSVRVVSRIWFNDANTSTWFYVPGILVLVLTISGVFLTAVVMAREYEHGTFEALFVTPVRPLEILLAKVIPYFVVAFFGMLLCLLAACLLYDMPLRGSLLLVLLASVCYLLTVLGIGLVLSCLTKNQFLACQISLLVSIMPTLMLSGFLFDLHTEPMGIRLVSAVFPATWYLALLKSLLLAGDSWPLILRNMTALSLYAVGFFALAYRLTKKEVA